MKRNNILNLTPAPLSTWRGDGGEVFLFKGDGGEVFLIRGAVEEVFTRGEESGIRFILTPV